MPAARPGPKDAEAGFDDPDRARILEVFSSLQGEGIRLGERQVFVRFGGCNLHCDYCDEPDTIPIPSGELWPRRRLEAEILRLAFERPTRSVSWTGGEPLLRAKFLAESLAWAREQGFQNYLETNGTLGEALAPLAPLCDLIAMDVKLPSATGRELWSSHLRFLRVAPDKTFVKVVLTAASGESEWRQVIRLLQEAGPQIPLVLQPSTPVVDSRDRVRGGVEPGGRPSRTRLGDCASVRGGVERVVESVPPERAIAFLRQARGLLKDVRLIPQWHPVWKLP